MAVNKAPIQTAPLFDNPFHIEDLCVFDDDSLRRILINGGFGVTIEQLAHSLHGASRPLVKRLKKNMTHSQRSVFRHELRQPLPREQVEQVRKQLLDNLFWELTYWKTPGLYEELTEGEQLHPGIFQQLEPELHEKTVLDVGAGSGRATFECLRFGAKLVHAVEPSPGLLLILKQKQVYQPASHRIIPHIGRFDAIPLPDNSVDTALSCSAFTANPEQGGEPGLTELQRVTRPGGKIIFVWPRVADRDWLTRHGFHYVTLPLHQEMNVHFRSLQSALDCAQRFYAHNKVVLHYILTKQKADVPFSVIGINPPRDYCWLEVNK